MPATYEPIATTTLGASAASIIFSSIPNTYTDLKVIFYVRGTRSNPTTEPRMRINGDTGTTYARTVLRGDGSLVESIRNTGQAYITLGTVIPSATATANLFSFIEIDIFSYTVSAHKTVLSSCNSSLNPDANWIDRVVGLWRVTDAINQITLYADIGNLEIGTTATLYGIKRA